MIPDWVGLTIATLGPEVILILRFDALLLVWDLSISLSDA